jgi:hypothetical protein
VGIRSRPPNLSHLFNNDWAQEAEHQTYHILIKNGHNKQITRYTIQQHMYHISSTMVAQASEHQTYHIVSKRWAQKAHHQTYHMYFNKNGTT